METYKYKSIKSFYCYKMLSLIVIYGTLIGFYFICTRIMHLSNSFSFYLILTTTFLVTAGIIALSQIEFKESFAKPQRLRKSIPQSGLS